VLWGRLTTSRVPEADGVSGLVGVLQDVTARKALEAELEQRASIDGLTGLPNRTRFSGAVARALASAPRAGGLVAVLVLDLDNFRTVNDSLGHVVGDRLLVLAAKRLLTATRAQDTVARLGGDEFAVLIEGAADVAAVAAIAGRITAAFADPFHVSDTTVLATASVGIATASTAAEGTPAATPEALLRDADAAMYGAKAHGKSRVALFEPAMHAAALVRLQLEADLRRAVDYQEFLLLYQPIVRLETGALAGLEALVRWQHPARGMLGPAAFIQAAEDTGLIVPLGAWVLREACRQLRAWQRAYGPDAPPAVTVNLSGRQLHGEGSGERLAAEVRAALDASGLAPAALVLEITESTAMQHTEANLAALAALKALGVKLAIDDFGTGYSSLAYLERFPLDVLKIDKSFVDHVTAGGKGLVLARAIIALGDALGLRTVAEGIERPEQAEALRALGCHLGQGYLFARPLVPADVDHLLGGSAKT
jgi:diguanylate cyclase (GGDEF)-like protein